MSGFRDYIGDALTSFIAGSEDCADFIVSQGENELVYVDIENSTFHLITVAEGEVHIGAERSPSAERTP